MLANDHTAVRSPTPVSTPKLIACVIALSLCIRVDASVAHEPALDDRTLNLSRRTLSETHEEELGSKPNDGIQMNSHSPSIPSNNTYEKYMPTSSLTDSLRVSRSEHVRYVQRHSTENASQHLSIRELAKSSVERQVRSVHTKHNRPHMSSRIGHETVDGSHRKGVRGLYLMQDNETQAPSPTDSSGVCVFLCVRLAIVCACCMTLVARGIVELLRAVGTIILTGIPEA